MRDLNEQSVIGPDGRQDRRVPGEGCVVLEALFG